MTGDASHRPDHVFDLVAMSTALSLQLRQAGIDAPGARQLADDAIGYSRKARAELGAADPRRATVAFNLGLLLVIRQISFPGIDTSDQDEAIEAIEDYLTVMAAAAAPPGHSDGQPDAARATLGWLLVARGLRLPDAGELSKRPDLHMAIIERLHDFTPTPDNVRDVARAVEVLRDVRASPTAPPDIKTMVLLAWVGASILNIMFSGGSLAEVLATLSGVIEEMRSLPAGTPGRLEVLGLFTWLTADYVRTSASPDPDGTALRDLAETASQVTPGHMLHAILQLELGLSTAYHVQQHGGDGLPAAAEHVARARAEMAGWPSHPMYDDSLRQLAGTLLTATAWKPRPEGIERVLDLARMLVADRVPADAAGAARDTYLLGMAYLLRASRGQQLADWEAATREMRAALARVPAADPMRPVMLATYAAALNDHFQMHGQLADAEMAGMLFDEISDVLGQPSGDQAFSAHDLFFLVGMRGVCRVSLGWQKRDLSELYQGEADIRRTLAGLPDHYPWRSRLQSGLGLAEMATGLLRRDYARIAAGAAAIVAAAQEMQVDEGSRLALRAAGALAQVMDGRLKADADAIGRGMAILAEVVAAPGANLGERTRLLGALGDSHLILHGLTGDGEDLDLGIARLEQARMRVDPDERDPVVARLCWGLAEAYHKRGGADDEELATEAGLAALRAHVHDVVLQHEAAHSLLLAQGAADRAVTVARWLYEQHQHATAIEALELGRGTVLTAATISALLPEILSAAGHADLAAEWVAATRGLTPDLTAAAEDGVQSYAMVVMLAGITLPVPELPGGLARRVIAAVRSDDDFSRRLTPPGVGEITAALRATGSDAVAYLVPGSEAEPGLLIALFADGKIVSLPADGLRVLPGGQATEFAETDQAMRRPGEAAGPASESGLREEIADGAWREALDAVTAWAWTAAMRPLLDEVRRRGIYRASGRSLPRLVLVPGGTLGMVPWHAAWTVGSGPGGGRTYACQQAVFTYAASARQFTDNARRTPLPVGSDPVFVADHTRKLQGAVILTRVLRGQLYPDARGYGWTGEDGEAAGTPEQVLAHFPGPGCAGASLFQFSCHARTTDTPLTSYLDLAAPVPAGESPPGESAAAGRLPVQRILHRAYQRRDPAAPGGLVVLAACVSDLTLGDYDEALTLATAFLAAGAVSVVGSRWEISDRVTPALMFMFHYFMRREGMTVADALQATQEWMLDPGRAIPPEMDPVIRKVFGTHDCTDIATWAAFTHQGR